MGEIVNLRGVKKRLARAGRAEQAAANRALHGRTKGEREADTRAAARREAVLDQARMDVPAESQARLDAQPAARAKGAKDTTSAS